MISDRLPAPQYKPKMKRCQSMAIDVPKTEKLEEMNIQKQETELKILATSRANSNQKRVVPQDRRIGASRVICNLPTI